MKSSNIITQITRISMMILLSLFLGCGGSDPALSASDQVKAKLTAKSWTLSSVKVDNIDQTTLFAGFSISFTATGFTTSNGDPVWPSSGSWTFTDENATAFTRSDGLIVTIQEVTATSLKMLLTWDKDTFGPGRTQSVSGQHVFTMVN